MNVGGTPPASFLSGAVPLTGANVGGGMDDLDLEEILTRLPCGVAATPSQPTTAVATTHTADVEAASGAQLPKYNQGRGLHAAAVFRQTRSSFLEDSASGVL